MYNYQTFWDVTTTYVNSALHPSWVAKSITSFGWGKGGKVTSVGWQVTLCDPIWHVISIMNCDIRVYFTLLTLTIRCSGTTYYTTKFQHFEGRLVQIQGLSRTMFVFTDFLGLENLEKNKDFQ